MGSQLSGTKSGPFEVDEEKGRRQQEKTIEEEEEEEEEEDGWDEIRDKIRDKR